VSEQQPRRAWWKRPVTLPLWGAVLAGFAILVLGGAMGGSAEPEQEQQAEPKEADSPAPAETVTVTATQAATVQATVRTTETVTAAPAPQQQAKPSEPEPERDVYTAGQYSFADVQVSDDGFGSYAIRARVTNTGDTVQAVIWTVTLFKSGKVVATADGTASDFEGGATKTIEFVSLDDFQKGVDEVEFQVDTQF
jgi:hypothetical protein